MKKTTVLLATLLTLVSSISMAGCSLLGSPIADKVADVVDDYCKEPLSARLLYRDTVNEALAAEGHGIEVTCFGDPVDDTAGLIGNIDAGELAAAVGAYCATPGGTIASTRHDVSVRCRDPGKPG